MGQKVSPIGFRIGVIRDWDARWFASKNYKDLLHEDLQIREYVQKTLQSASVSRIEIERAANNLRINIHTAKPGMVIG
ncbi:MAG: KH domain-containing protein, partial [Dethiobacteria bacterium]